MTKWYDLIQEGDLLTLRDKTFSRIPNNEKVEVISINKKTETIEISYGGWGYFICTLDIKEFSQKVKVQFT